jgi:hypothetical protein
MYIPTVFDQYDGTTNYGTLNSVNMIPAQSPGGPVREPSGFRKVPPRTWTTPDNLQGATMRSAKMRNEPCKDNHFDKTFRPGKFKGSSAPLMNQYGNFHHQKEGLLSQYYIQKDNPILQTADIFYPQFNSSIPQPV